MLPITANQTDENNMREKVVKKESGNRNVVLQHCCNTWEVHNKQQVFTVSETLMLHLKNK